MFLKNLDIGAKKEHFFPMFLYIDPGLGGLLVQSLIAGCLTVVYFFRNSISRVFVGVKRLFGVKKEDSKK